MPAAVWGRGGCLVTAALLLILLLSHKYTYISMLICVLYVRRRGKRGKRCKVRRIEIQHYLPARCHRHQTSRVLAQRWCPAAATLNIAHCRPPHVIFLSMSPREHTCTHIDARAIRTLLHRWRLRIRIWPARTTAADPPVWGASPDTCIHL